MLYIIAIVIGLVAGSLYGNGASKLEDIVASAVLAGKRVVLSFDSDAIIYEKKDGRIVITRGVVDYSPEPVEEYFTND